MQKDAPPSAAMTVPDLTRLLQAAAHGDRAAVGRLFEATYADLLRIARALLRTLGASRRQVVGVVLGAISDLITVAAPDTLRGKQMFMLGSTSFMGWDALALLGAGNAQMEAVSFGKERPAVQGSDEAAYAKNRRAELVYR